MTTGDGIKYIDLFGGIGGFRLGIEQATHKEWKCLWYNDFNKYSVKIYNKNFKEKYEPKDIKEVDAKDIPRHDLICAGFPCQSFSIAGKKKGFEDTRGTLFFEICRIARFHKPKYLFLENVKGLLSHNKGETFKTILESLWKLGYDVEWQLLNSKNHGVPQNRERIFIIGHLGGFNRNQVFPLRKRTGMGDKEQKQIEMIHNSGKEIARIYSTDGIAPTLKGKTGGWQEPKIVEDFYRTKRKNSIYTECPTLRGDRTGLKVANTIDCDGYLRSGKRPRDREGKPQLLPLGYRRIRKLTPIECERLQGFPDNWTNGISDTQRYKALGNAVTVNVIHDIIEKWCQKGDT